MTDDEIITALECCCNLERIGCEECPQYELHSAMCIKDVMNKALGLINCQKAEIERLAARFNDYPVKTLIDNNNMMCSKSSEDYDKWFFNVSKDISYRTIKEFADRLKNEMRLEDDCQYDCMGCLYACKEYVPMIDNLVKEMTEVQENGK